MAFTQLEPEEVVSFNVPDNLPSRAVVRAIGMRRDAAGDVLHPQLAAGHPLWPHVLYRLHRDEWEGGR